MNNDVASYLIENVAYEFWTLVGETSSPALPRNIQEAIILALPLELYAVPALRVSHVLDWTQRVHLSYGIRGRNRRLHGCLLAAQGQGTIFFDVSDAESEQRFTLAHELAHFLLDYMYPRERALTALGSSILSVLNGERPPTVEERLYAVLDGVPLGVMSHVLERPDTGLPTAFVIAIEDRADRLALELLAPAQALFTLMRSSAAPAGFVARLAFLTQSLIQSYGIPDAIAVTYGRYILGQMGEPTFRDWLSGSDA